MCEGPCTFTTVSNLYGAGLLRPPLHHRQDTLNIPTKGNIFRFVCMCTHLCCVVEYLSAKKKQRPYHVLCIGALIIVGVLTIGFVWQMKSFGIYQYIPPMKFDCSNIMSSDKLDKVNVFNPAAPDKPDLYEFDRNQPGVKIHVHVSECTIICTAVVLVLVAVIIYMYLSNEDHYD